MQPRLRTHGRDAGIHSGEPGRAGHEKLVEAGRAEISGDGRRQRVHDPHNTLAQPGEFGLSALSREPPPRRRDPPFEGPATLRCVGIPVTGDGFKALFVQ